MASSEIKLVIHTGNSGSRRSTRVSRATQGQVSPTLGLEDKLALLASTGLVSVESLVDEQTRTDALVLFREHTLEYLTCGNQRQIESISRTQEAWCFSRFRSLLAVLAAERRRPQCLAVLMESLNWAHEACHSAVSGTDDLEADKHVWDLYAVHVRNLTPHLPRMRNDDMKDAMSNIRDEALLHFSQCFCTAIRNADISDVLESFTFLPQLSFGFRLYPLMVERALKDANSNFCAKVVPLLLLMCTVDEAQNHLLDAILEHSKAAITPAIINAMLEYSAHVAHSTAGITVLGSFREMISVEAIAASLLSACGKGNDHYLSLLQLHVIDNLEQDSINGLLFTVALTENNYTCFIAPFIYLVLGITCFTGVARTALLGELIAFHDDQFSELMVNTVSKPMLENFICDVFATTCRLGHWNLVEGLISLNWVNFWVNCSTRATSWMILSRQPEQDTRKSCVFC